MGTKMNEMQRVKREFFTLRNGLLGDLLRRQGLNYKIIFGLNIPQLIEIAATTPHDAQLAQQLWENKTTRESLLLAPMIYPKEQFTLDNAKKWVSEVPTTEVADVLCHRLLRHLEYANELAQELAGDENDLVRYTALRLMFNLLPNNVDSTLLAAQHELIKNVGVTAPISRALIEEINYLKEGQ